MSSLPTISFSSNWNNKLNCKSFSSVRLGDGNKYHLHKEYTIILKNQPIYTAQLVSITKFQLLDLSPAMSYLDTGYSPQEQQKMMEKMYKNKNIDVYKVPWLFLVFVHKLLSESEQAATADYISTSITEEQNK